MDTFALQRNNFTGSLPSELGNMKDMTFFNVGRNLFTGTLPVELTTATNLLIFSLCTHSLREIGEASTV